MLCLTHYVFFMLCLFHFCPSIDEKKGPFLAAMAIKAGILKLAYHSIAIVAAKALSKCDTKIPRKIIYKKTDENDKFFDFILIIIFYKLIPVS